MNIHKALETALAHHRAGDLQQAELMYRKILKKRPGDADALHLLGALCHQRGDNESAIKYIKKALQADPRFAEAYNNLGNALRAGGRVEEAIVCYKKTIEIDPGFAAAHNNLGNVYQEKGAYDEAIAYYRKALQYKPDFMDAYNNLGSALQEKGLFDEAIQYYEKALSLNPYSPSTFLNLGTLYKDKGLPDEAVAHYRKALQLNPNLPDAHWNMALAYLLSGNLEKGWESYAWRWETEDFIHHKRSFSQPPWNGSDISGRTILLHAEQGLGDTIQFVRYAPLVAGRGAKVIFECQKTLTALLQGVEGIHQIIPRGDRLPEFELHSPLLSLPLIFNTNLETIPARTPYIQNGPGLVKTWEEKIHSRNSRLNVGMAWAGNPAYRKDRYRSCPLDAFAPLAELEGITFYSLQKGAGSEQAKNPPEGMKLIDYTGEIHDFSDTAALIQTLDLVISVDTATAHLAGALGKPVWTLLPFSPDWRWMLGREDSPWYPTMRLFRQSSPGDWGPVIQSVLHALQVFPVNSNARE